MSDMKDVDVQLVGQMFVFTNSYRPQGNGQRTPFRSQSKTKSSRVSVSENLHLVGGLNLGYGGSKLPIAKGQLVDYQISNLALGGFWPVSLANLPKNSKI